MHHERSHKNDFFKQFFLWANGVSSGDRRKKRVVKTGYMVGRKEENIIQEVTFKKRGLEGRKRHT
jgi:hypothetical protein